MSLTQWLTRSRPMVLCVSVRNATLSFVPTPSADATRTGCFKFGNAPSNIPPKLPISESVRALKVVRASCLIFSFAMLAASIETPASLYEMDFINFEFCILSFKFASIQNSKLKNHHFFFGPGLGLGSLGGG